MACAHVERACCGYASRDRVREIVPGRVSGRDENNPRGSDPLPPGGPRRSGYVPSVGVLPRSSGRARHAPRTKGGVMRATPLTRDQCNNFVTRLHRHHGAVTGYRYGVGVIVNQELVGVAVVGRPRARLIHQYQIVEVTRVCTDGTQNACSFLYGLCSRLCRLLGFSAVFTCILDTEPGTSLKAAGWEMIRMTGGGTQDRPSRRRVDHSPTCPKQVWAPAWCAAELRSGYQSVVQQ